MTVKATESEQLARAVRNPGRLVLGPTATTGSFPFGGVELGAHRDAEVVWQEEQIRVRDPLSGRTSEVGRNGAAFPEVFCIIEGPQWDEDLLVALFSRATRSTDDPAETRAEGDALPQNYATWPPLAFIPDDLNLKAVYFRRPIPTLSLRQSTALSQEFRCGLPVRFVPTVTIDWQTIPDWQVARWENISL